MTSTPIRILFVCSGNTCRSPMAAALLERELRASQVSAEVSSAGVASCDGAPASPEAVAVMDEVGVDLSSHASRSATAADFDRAHLIIAMTDSHLTQITLRAPAASDRTRVLGIADPFGSSLTVYRETRDRLAAETAEIARGLIATAGR